MNFLQNYAHAIGRVLLSMIFIMAGLIKLDDPTVFAALLESIAIPGNLVYALIAVEVIGGFMILIGYQTRNAAIILSCLYIAGAVSLNMTLSNQMEIMTFVQNLGLAGGFLILFSKGAGKMSLDNLVK